MDEKEPLWYNRLLTGPLSQEPQPQATHLSRIKSEVVMMRRPRRLMNASSIIVLLAVSAIVLFTWVIPQLESKDNDSIPSSGQNLYAGIDVADIPPLPNFELIQSYKGVSDNWAANYITYKEEGGDQTKSVIYLKYLGGKPYPLGELKATYALNEEQVGGGTALYAEEPKEGIYYLGSYADDVSVLDKNSVITLQIIWNTNKSSDILQLKDR